MGTTAGSFQISCHAALEVGDSTNLAGGNRVEQGLKVAEDILHAQSK